MKEKENKKTKSLKTERNQTRSFVDLLLPRTTIFEVKEIYKNIYRYWAPKDTAHSSHTEDMFVDDASTKLHKETLKEINIPSEEDIFARTLDQQNSGRGAERD